MTEHYEILWQFLKIFSLETEQGGWPVRKQCIQASMHYAIGGEIINRGFDIDHSDNLEDWTRLTSSTRRGSPSVVAEAASWIRRCLGHQGGSSWRWVSLPPSFPPWQWRRGQSRAW